MQPHLLPVPRYGEAGEIVTVQNFRRIGYTRSSAIEISVWHADVKDAPAT